MSPSGGSSWILLKNVMIQIILLVTLIIAICWKLKGVYKWYFLLSLNKYIIYK